MDTSNENQSSLISTISANAYSIVIVLLIALIAFMVYPSMFLYFVLALVIPMSLGILVEMGFQTEYYKSLGYQLSRLEKTAIISSVVGISGLSLGFFSNNIMNWLEGFMISI